MTEINLVGNRSREYQGGPDRKITHTDKKERDIYKKSEEKKKKRQKDLSCPLTFHVSSARVQERRPPCLF